jgi:pantothenate kinase-related protein Tda10
MCKVKSGAKIKNQQDVQNLVIGIIFRQRAAYQIDNILSIVLYYMKNSQYEISVDDLYDTIADTLDMLRVRNRVKCRNGIYTPLPLKVLSMHH